MKYHVSLKLNARRSIAFALMVGFTSIALFAFTIIGRGFDPLSAAPADEFVTVWKTDNPGTSNSTSITIPTTGAGYLYDVDWNNDSVFDDIGVTGDITHDYTVAGTYTVRIRGTFPRIYFNNGGDKDKILDVAQWGTGSWTSMQNAFYGASNMTVTATDAPDLSGVTDLSSMFQAASSANPDVSGWNTGAVTNMHSMFNSATAANPDVSTWNTAAVTDMSFMFNAATSATPDTSSWNTSSVTNMSTMFGIATSANPIMTGWDVSNVTDMTNMFLSVTLPLANYDATLAAWDAQTLQSGVAFHGGNSNYCSSYAEHANMIASDSWVITDGGEDCSSIVFLTQWKTDNPGTSNSTSITIPTTGVGYLYDVDWENDGTFDDFGVTGSITHDYTVAGTYDVAIRGSFPRIYFNNGGDKDKILDVAQWGDIAWANMTSAFYGTSNMTVTATDAPDLSGVAILQNMFKNALLADPDTSAWDVSTITNMVEMFSGASSANPDVSTWDTSSVTNMSTMFSNADSANPDVSNWDMSSVTSTALMFFDTAIATPDTSTWDVSSVTAANRMFENALLANPDVSAWDTSAMARTDSMFRNADSANPDVSGWDMSSVTNTSLMFSGTALANPDVSAWDTGSVTNMNNMFASASAADPDVSAWDTSSVTNMTSMFAFNSVANPDVSLWDTSSVTTVSSMFRSASSATPNTTNWDTSSITIFGSMFFNATVANPDTSLWDTSAATNMSGIFYGAPAATPDTSGWDTSNVTTMASMFYNATSATPDTSSWDTSNVTTMASMFRGATSANPTMTGWDVSNVTDMTNMFFGVTLPTANYDATLTAWNAQTLQSAVPFSGGNSLYCASAADRANMISTDSWVITDGGQDCQLTITITAPTKLSNVSMTDTTIQVTDLVGVNAASVTVDGSTTATTSSLVCLQTTAAQVDCTISIDSSGDLTIAATDTSSESTTATESNYVLDTTPPNVPSVTVDTSGGVSTPTITFTTTDNIAVDYYEIDYNADDGGAGLGTPTTLTPAVSPVVALNLDPDEVANAPFVHTITVRVFDTAGNSSQTVLSFPPIVSYTAPTTIFNTTINDTTLTITSPLGNNIDQVTLAPGTTGTPVISCAADLGGGVYASPASCTVTGITATGTIDVSARDVVIGAVGNTEQSYIIETTDPVAVITAPTKIDNAAITDTTVVITDDTAINAGDIAITAINTTGSFSISAVSCTQTSTVRVDCTLQVDANDGTGDIQVSSTDVATNNAVISEAGYTIDVTPPATPAAAPDLQAASDLGTSSTDDITSDITPSFDIVCTEIGATITIYTDNPAASTAVGTHTCVAAATETATASLPDGVHNVTYSEADVLGNESAQSPSLAVTVDDTAPTANTPDLDSSSDTGTSNTDDLTNDTTPDFTVACETGTSVEIFEGGVTSLGTGTCVGGNVTITSIVTLGTGPFTITTVETDPAGNVSTPSAGLVITIDTTAPGTPAAAPDLQAASDTGVSSTDDDTSDNTPSLDVVCSEVGAVITLYSDNPVASTVIGTHTCVAVATETATVSPAIADGTHNISYSETDLAGNESPQSAALPVVIDTTAPAAPSTPDLQAASDTGASNTDDNTANTTPSFDVVCSIIGATMTLYSDNPVASTVIGTHTCTAIATETATVSPAVADGTHNVTVSETDLAGNESPQSSALPLTIDTTAPSAPTVDAPAPAGVTGGTISGSAGTPGDTIDVTVQGTGETCSATVSGAGTWSCNLAPSPADGPIVLDVTATDPAGNTSPVTTVSATMDTTAPVAPAAPDLQAASDTGSSSTDDITTATTPAFDVVCNDIGHTMTLYSDLPVASTVVGTHVCVTGTGATETLTIAPAIADGSHNVTVTETDLVALESPASAALTVVVDTSAPAAPTTPDLDASSDTGFSNADDNTSDSIPSLTIACVSGTEVELFEGGTNSLGTGTCVAGTVTITSILALADGPYSLTARQTDPAGNTSAASTPALSIVIDTTAPSAPSAPDLQAASDTGPDNTDNNTNVTTPSVDVACPAAGFVITLYSDNPTASTLLANHTCLGAATETIAVTPALSEGIHTLTATETDLAGNTSPEGSPLALTIDTTAPSAPSINTPTNGNPVTGTAEPGSQIVVTTTSAATCTTTVAANGSWSCVLTPTPVDGEDVMASTTDIAGNTSAAATKPAGISLTAASDSDGDGVADSIEDSVAPGGDGNGDSIADRLQNNVTSVANAVSGAYTTVQVASGCTVVASYAVVAEDSLTAQDDNFNYPVGLNDFTLTCVTAGDSADVTFYYDQAYDTSSWVYKKYDGAGNVYSDISSIVSYGTATVSGATVTTTNYTVTDGGSTDTDGTANGTIIDPAGPAVAIEGLSETGSSQAVIIAVGAIIAIVPTVLLGMNIRRRRSYAYRSYK